MGSLLPDLAFSARTLLRRPGFALLAVLTVALGIGINTAMFTIVNGVLWKALPYPDSDRLVMFNEASASGPLNCSYPNFEDWRRSSALFEDIALARQFPPATLRLEGSVESVPTGYAHPNLFSLLGVRPALGRLFTAEEDNSAAEPMAAITHRAWEQYFASDPSVIGRHIRLHISFEGKTVESMVIGAVLPPDFRYENIDLWLPLNRFWGHIDEMRSNDWFRGIGKLKPGVTLERARRDLDAVSRDLERQYPATNKDVRPMVAGLIDYYAGRVRTPLLLLFGAVGFVMLIACGNVVHLLLTRTLGRSREIAVRLALGAARGRLLQLLLAESLLIAVAGGTAGVFLARWAVVWTVASQPRTLPRAQTLQIDGSALLYALAVTALTFGILGLTPLWQASRANVLASLQSAGRGGTDRKQRRLGWGMVAAELAMASILLTGAGLMIQTLRNLSLVNLGYRPEGVLSVPINLPGYKYAEQGQSEAVTGSILREIESLPGFVSAAYAEPFQVGGNGMLPALIVPGRTNPMTPPMIPTMQVSSGFFEALRIPLRAGRFFAKPHPVAREAANLLAKFLATQLYGVTAHDPSIYAAVIALIAAVALAASAVPCYAPLTSTRPLAFGQSNWNIFVGGAAFQAATTTFVPAYRVTRRMPARKRAWQPSKRPLHGTLRHPATKALPSSHIHAAVDRQHVSGDIGGVLAGEKLHSRCNIFGPSHAGQGNRRQNLLLYIVGQVLGHIGRDVARRHRVHRDAAAGHLLRQCLRQADEAGLGCGVVGLPGAARLSHHR
ncbi:MAG: ABC transporter permease [Acidobacteriia bacterium]|nr:ABC transporter permease [Terriglobia bacterium]